MDFIYLLTGNSPSTTGPGSERALTGGLFNALWPILNLNTALVSYILTGLASFPQKQAPQAQGCASTMTSVC
jgi:hypothetical protein